MPLYQRPGLLTRPLMRAAGIGSLFCAPPLPPAFHSPRRMEPLPAPPKANPARDTGRPIGGRRY
jgi:hypothetical protein